MLARCSSGPPADSGTVQVNHNAQGGNQILIQTPAGGRAGYSHTGAAQGIASGTPVTAGQVIGHSDGSGMDNGRPVTPHTHYTSRPPGSNTNVDPLTHLPQ